MFMFKFAIYLIFNPELSRKKYWKCNSWQQPIECKWNWRILSIGCETNNPDFPKANANKHMETMLHYICSVFNFTWHIHVVKILCLSKFRADAKRKLRKLRKIDVCTLSLSVCVSFRFPDFLFQLQNYDGSPKILCEVVGPKVAANSTDQMLVVFSTNTISQWKFK